MGTLGSVILMDPWEVATLLAMAKKLLNAFSPSSMLNVLGSPAADVHVMVIGPSDVTLVAIGPIVSALAVVAARARTTAEKVLKTGQLQRYYWGDYMHLILENILATFDMLLGPLVRECR